jgi:hypothetical protein
MPPEMIFRCHRCLQPYASAPWALDASGEILPEAWHCEACRACPDDFDVYECPHPWPTAEKPGRSPPGRTG